MRNISSLLKTHLLAPAALVSLIVLRSATQDANKSQTFQLKPCEVNKLKGNCGALEVFENRATRRGRKIQLQILVAPATGPKREPDPFVYIPGGPGSSAIEDASYVVQQFKRINEKRDLLFVDQRGTGGSHPLNCTFFNVDDPQSYFGYYFPLDDVRKCRKELEATSDLTLYTTSIAMDDLDDVRAALGYEKLNLFGGSYGTRAAMTYLKRHPDHVRTVTLHGVSPMDHYMPHDFPKQTERALQGILAECDADEACHKAFPNIRAESQALLERLIKGPVEVEVRTESSRGAEKQKLANVQLSRDLAAEAIRYMLYNSAVSPRIPLILHLAAEGNFVPLAEAALNYRRNIVATGSNGLYLSITCAEDLPWIKPGEGEALAKNTFLGDYRLRQQREACSLWPQAQIEKDYSQPARSALPVLIFTGQWDPVTPPSNGDGVARYLTNSLHVVVPQGGHAFGGLEGLECLERLNVEFVEKGSVKDLDPSCTKNIKRRDFALSL
jgi:pimeloyl-ACP methyl ester carboxylesterase